MAVTFNFTSRLVLYCFHEIYLNEPHESHLYLKKKPPPPPPPPAKLMLQVMKSQFLRGLNLLVWWASPALSYGRPSETCKPPSLRDL